MPGIPKAYRDIIDKPVFAHLATSMHDGSPQVSAVWIDQDGDRLLVNSVVGRLKDKNLRADSRIAISVVDPDNPYRSLAIRGRVVEITEQGAAAHIDKMAKKYLGQDKYPFAKPGEKRVIYVIEADKVGTMG